MIKVFVGVGHGGRDSGAVGYVVEKDVNLKIANACTSYLRKHNVEVMQSRTTDIDDDLSDKIKRANEFNADISIDIHNNAGKGKGFEVYHTKYNGVGKDIAESIEKRVIGIGQNSRGLKINLDKYGNDYFGFIRMINKPSIILEGAFVDNEEDAKFLYNGGCIKLGEAYAKGILDYFNIPIIETINKTNKTEKLYRVQVGAFNIKENAEALRDGLINRGYDAFIVEN